MRRIPDDNLAYPVFLSLDTGISGSAFFLNDDERVYLVTAKHVLFDDGNNILGKKAKLICQPKYLGGNDVTEISVDLELLNKNNDLEMHPKADVCGFPIGIKTPAKDHSGYVIQELEGIKFTKDAESGMIGVNCSNVRLLSDVLISNEIILYGYPSSIGLKRTPQFDYSKPLLRTGIVAGTHKKAGTIILDCPVFYGNSGGPVIQITLIGKTYKHDVIGVASEFIPYAEQWQNLSNKLVNTEVSNSGYSVAVAMDYVFDMLGIKKPKPKKK